jgi:hypothetical protein
MAPTFTAENGMVRPIFGDLMDIEEARDRLRIIADIALDHEDEFAAMSIRRATDLIWAIRTAKAQATVAQDIVNPFGKAA